MWAQITGDILVTVADPTGAVVPNATVTVKNKDTGATRPAVTDNSGTVRVSQLAIGEYEVRIEAAGFAPIQTAAQVVTGSTATGKAISAVGAAQLKRFGLELGGKTPMILFETADLAEAMPVLEKALTTFAGQFCMTGSRLLVHSSIADEVRAQLGKRLAAVRPGPASDPASDMGPMIDKANVARVDAMVDAAIQAGARAIVRGGPVTDGPLAPGAFYRPTLLEIADPSLTILREEVFGPVLTLEVFDTEAEAITRANDSRYGLAASVWSRDIDQPLRVAQELQAGTVWINDWAMVYDEFEEGGYKQSGQGRLNGLAALEDFTEYKHIALRPGAG